MSLDIEMMKIVKDLGNLSNYLENFKKTVRDSIPSDQLKEFDKLIEGVDTMNSTELQKRMNELKAKNNA